MVALYLLSHLLVGLVSTLPLPLPSCRAYKRGAVCSHNECLCSNLSTAMRCQVNCCVNAFVLSHRRINYRRALHGDVTSTIGALICIIIGYDLRPSVPANRSTFDDDVAVRKHPRLKQRFTNCFTYVSMIQYCWSLTITLHIKWIILVVPLRVRLLITAICHFINL